MTLTEKVTARIREQFAGDASGHDWHHVQRVLQTARYLQSKEGGDLELVELAALLHDISDHKLNGGILDAGGTVAYELLIDLGAPEELAGKVRYIVDHISYKGANTPTEMESLEGRIVQDADRLDAIGALGIARTFAYGGHKGQPMYDPDAAPTLHSSFQEYVNGNTSTINHFYEKLLLLSDRLNTATAREIGRERHQFMETFLAQFYKEWNFNAAE